MSQFNSKYVSQNINLNVSVQNDEEFNTKNLKRNSNVYLAGIVSLIDIKLKFWMAGKGRLVIKQVL